MERINDKENRATYDNMLAKRREKKSQCTAEISNIKDLDSAIQKRKKEMKSGIHLIDDIIESSGISNTHLRMLVEKVIIHENENGLSIAFNMKAPFCMHLDIYGDGNTLKEKAFASIIGELGMTDEDYANMNFDNESCEYIDYVQEYARS